MPEIRTAESASQVPPYGLRFKNSGRFAVRLKAAQGDEVQTKLRATAAALFLACVILGAKSVSMFFAGAHFGSPMTQTCRYVELAVAKTDNGYPGVDRACSQFMAQYEDLSMRYDSALATLVAASIGLFILSVIVWSCSWPPPRNAAKDSDP